MLLENTIHLGDCLELMKEIPDASVDMILCDLPYGTTACKWDSVIPFKPLWEAYNRVIKDNGAIVLTASQPFSSAVVMSSLETYRHQWVWNKGVSASFALCNVAPMKIHEDVLVFSRKKVRYFPIKTPKEKPLVVKHKQKQFETAPLQKRFEHPVVYTESYPTTLISISSRSEKRGLHPTQKPVALFEYLIKTYTNAGDLVLDNCAGSGTTAVACKQTGRRYLCIEKDRDYWLKACERVNQSLGLGPVAKEASQIVTDPKTDTPLA